MVNVLQVLAYGYRLCLALPALYEKTDMNASSIPAVFEAGRESMRAFQKWRLQGPRLERAAILGRKRGRGTVPV